MAFASDTHGINTGIVARMRTALRQAYADYARHRSFNRTINELGKLTDRDLEDLGITRSQIAEVAHTATYGG